ncbi:MAG: DUF3369 domain-containing protein [Methylococcales bacterium]
MDFFTKVALSTQAQVTNIPVQAWCVLMVDDDPDVHVVTRMALRGFEFHKRPLELLSAYSASEARNIFQQRNDIALAMIDVVMESEHAGLDLVEHLRSVCKNNLTRIVLRTGQAGQAPEDRVIREYEIDDYKEKTDLTTQKLRTLLYSMLRSYRDICVIEAQRNGLSNVLNALPLIQGVSTLHIFASKVLEQLTSLLHLGESALYCMMLPGGDIDDREVKTLAATGEFIHFQVGDALKNLPGLVIERFRDVLEQKQSIHFADAYVLFLPTSEETCNLLYVTHDEPLTLLDKQLLELYIHNVAVTFQNISLFEDLQDTSKELVYLLAGAVEARSKETGAHVQRVALASERLAELVGLPNVQVKLIKHASPLHDIGKVAIPDSILHKPGKLDDAEWVLMRKHVEYGVEILKNSRRPLIRMGSEIAASHHEKWDGSGYPNRLAGTDIPISGRISALADVFDALGAKRSYKDPWPDDKILELIESERGKHFDPALVDLFIANFGDFLSIRNLNPDN